PSNVIQTLPKRRAITEERTIEGIEDCLERNDDLTGTKNNWLSILCHGLLHSNGMALWVTERHNATLVK
ncbi:hypothetical protein AB4369_28525, partial [Vibrio sp. 10N.261.49.A5]